MERRYEHAKCPSTMKTMFKNIYFVIAFARKIKIILVIVVTFSTCYHYHGYYHPTL